jgi:hypothetical protein
VNDRARQPEWPVRSWPDKATAVAAAFEEMDRAGEKDPVVFVHAYSCGVKWDQDCDCSVELIMEVRGQA